ncbi:hypothetical protein K435DRAFT_472016 [Dendrothele bispora CBS 962.96]|uniref:Uncharacterized protein n=1 Tax=Dendrothele bispora (strain CBS 962.96) TaxID=1314807 RepID=A0A4S8KZJ8_DENBC|nr:hypothetical protein K435DRAFT_472016 [Dendrothele bispora CBS 962.96]
MTESHISPSDIQQYWTSRDRVKNWVQANVDAVFSSPNAPPTELDDIEGLSSPPSEAESSHSLPPALMLKYPDGREVPIPRARMNPSLAAPGSKNSHSSSSKSRLPIDPSSSHRSRSGSHPSGRSGRYPDLNEREKLRSHSPEEIRILPSESQTQSGSDQAHRVPTHISSQQHSRSRSLPRNVFSPASQDHDPMPNSTQGYAPYHSPSNSHHSNTSPVQLQHTPQLMATHGPPVGLARSQPIPWHGPYPPNGMRQDYSSPSREHFKHSPPSIVYAPSPNRSTSNYQPPMIFSYPPNVGPNGMMYSHSVPPTHIRHPHGGPPPQSHVPGARMPIPEEMRPRRHDSDRDRERDRNRDRERDRDRDRAGERERSHGRSKSNSSRHSPKERSEKSSSSWGKSSTKTRSGRDRSRSLPLDREMPPMPAPRGHQHSRYGRPPTPAGSDGSGSTYYVLPNGKQKVHVLVSTRFF